MYILLRYNKKGDTNGCKLLLYKTVKVWNYYLREIILALLFLHVFCIVGNGGAKIKWQFLHGNVIHSLRIASKIKVIDYFWHELNYLNK